MPATHAPLRPKTRKKNLPPIHELAAHELYKDPARQAELAGLRYATDAGPGISRQPHATDKFLYLSAKGEEIADEKTLARIHSFVIPPAWTDVWIAPNPRFHLQVTGHDTAGRKQYRYHPAWDAARSLTKFSRLLAFGQKLGELRGKLRKDLARPGLDRDKVVALVLTLMDQSFIRIGNEEYAKKNKSYGLTTLLDDHVEITKADVRFSFVGKKGVAHDVTIHDRKLAQLVRKCKDIPGQHLFQFYSADGQRHPLESGHVNDYLHQHTGISLSAKDFRTWGGTVKMVECLESVLSADVEVAPEKAIRQATKEVANNLGNTPTVCSKYYIHPQVTELFKSGKLIEYLRRHDADPQDRDELSPTEHLVLEMLAEI
ncbi:DNA topoisomerase IB [Hymenobacter sp. H14-R3]|uniref:DNA topoisomerase IB n=1 Tax=Hymenobacter sp. H14-R3 TaxID=3046308 RepID=UPI0024BB9A77|nr:DNA topoisomerase IB [Hymenobacter sp. H14-R3]MDJ0366052.1 DNA topoisomerase IB [Hymenobacter sp. H14-R3]